MNDKKGAALALYRAFVEQGSPSAWLATCCNRLYVGLKPAGKCRNCSKAASSIEVRSEADIEKWALQGA